jgi:uncharacterized RDD family membrane protein YckC
MGRRIAAYAIDTALLFVVTLIAFFALAESDPFSFDEDTGDRITRAFGDLDSDFQSTWDFGEQVGGFISIDDGEIDIQIVEGGSFWAVTAVSLGGTVALLVLMQGLTGRTPGKALVGITTVDAAGTTPGVGRAFVRTLLLIVDAFFLLPGLISSLTSKGHKRIGDMAAGTFVVRSTAAGQPVVVGAPQYSQPPMAYGGPAPDAQWDPARQAWIRWDGATWTQYDPTIPGGWRPIS